MSANQPIVSVVIPVYNVEDYLAECLDSILNQTLDDIEVICVNDGSTDSSLEIMHQYASQDDRIRIIDKENGGYGHSVNRGLEAATGEWISIIEPDDFIERHMYEDLVKNAEVDQLVDTRNGGQPERQHRMADIVKSSYWLYFDLENGTDSYREQPHLMHCMPSRVYAFNVEEDCEILKHHPSIWSAIYRKEFLDTYGIRMIEPKGAGWADNPWFFETMLCAQTVVWTPAAYYSYRQTNPNASSKLKDFHLPFDRLRDIRAIYEKFEIDNPKLLTVLYLRSFNYICNSLLDEFGFPESDPELQELIRETLETMDEKLVLAPKNGLSITHKDYYKDFMGFELAGVKPRPATSEPTVSILLPLRDDRKMLWATIHSFLEQSFESFEVIGIDCSTTDRAAQIMRDISAIDARFSLLDDQCDSIVNGYSRGLGAACGEYIYFCRSGIVLGKTALQEAVRALRAESSASCDIAVMCQEFKTTLDVTPVKWKTPTQNMPSSTKRKTETLSTVCYLEREGHEAEIAIASNTSTYSKLFKKQFLIDNNIGFVDEGDDDGRAFSIRAIMSCTRVALVRRAKVDTWRRTVQDENALEDEADLIADARKRMHGISKLMTDFDTPTASRMIHSVLVRVILRSLGRLGLQHSGEQYYRYLKSQFYDEFKLTDVPQPHYANFDEFLHLEASFALPYDQYLKKSADDIRESEEAMRKQRNAARKRASEAEKNLPAKLTRKITKAVRSIKTK